MIYVFIDLKYFRCSYIRLQTFTERIIKWNLLLKFLRINFKYRHSDLHIILI